MLRYNPEIRSGRKWVIHTDSKFSQKARNRSFKKIKLIVPLEDEADVMHVCCFGRGIVLEWIQLGVSNKIG